MPRSHNKPDPYDGFKDDIERRKALNTRVRCAVLATVAVAFFTGNWMGRLRWLISLFH